MKPLETVVLPRVLFNLLILKIDLKKILLRVIFSNLKLSLKRFKSTTSSWFGPLRKIFFCFFFVNQCSLHFFLHLLRWFLERTCHFLKIVVHCKKYLDKKCGLHRILLKLHWCYVFQIKLKRNFKHFFHTSEF